MRKSRAFLALIFIVLILVLPGCGSTPQAATSTVSSEGVVVSLFAEPMTVKPGSQTLLTLTVRNTTSSKKSFSLPSAMEFDFAAFVKSGTEVWRYSSGKAFAQVVTTKEIAPGAMLTYRAGWTPTSAGKYTVQGYFAGSPDVRPQFQLDVAP